MASFSKFERRSATEEDIKHINWHRETIMVSWFNTLLYLVPFGLSEPLLFWNISTSIAPEFNLAGIIRMNTSVISDLRQLNLDLLRSLYALKSYFRTKKNMFLKRLVRSRVESVTSVYGNYIRYA